MKNLLIATDSFLPRWDGVARFLSQIIPELADKYKITVVAPAFVGTVPRFKNTRVVRLKLSKRMHFGDITFAEWNNKRMKMLVEQADIVWTHTIGPIGIMAARAARKMKKSLVAYVHSIEWELTSKSVAHFKKFVHYMIRRMARRIYNNFDLIIVPTREAARILQFNKIRPPKVVVYLGVKADTFVPPGSKEDAKKKINISPSTVLIGFSGRIAREKDLPTLYKAFVRLRPKYKNIMLMIVGAGPENQKQQFKGRRVKLTGAKDSVLPYIQAMDIYVLPSLTETSSLSTMEAMSCGVAVIATKVGFVKYYLKEKKNGLLFAKHDSWMLQQKLETLIKDQELRERLGAAARKTIVEKHQWKITVQRIRKVLAGF